MLRALVLALALAGPAFAQDAAPLPRVALDTSAGRIVIEADVIHAPITAGDFLKYVDQHRLDGITFYRTVKAADRFGFVQFGVNGDPKRVRPPIAHEPTTATGLSHIDGTISVARLAPGSARGEFTISVGDQSKNLDADPTRPADVTRTDLGYAAFGHVIAGMDVVVRIMDAPVDPAKDVRGAFKGEVPAVPVKVLSARRL